MKKALFVLMAAVISLSVHAQLVHTQWKGAIYGDNPRNTLLKFSKDTATLYDAANGQVIETMTYKLKGNQFTLLKIYGQSDCDTHTTGSYTFSIKTGVMKVAVSADDCYDRSSALDKTSWQKTKYRASR